jgi:hypothetical protein
LKKSIADIGREPTSDPTSTWVWVTGGGEPASQVRPSGGHEAESNARRFIDITFGWTTADTWHGGYTALTTMAGRWWSKKIQRGQTVVFLRVIVA